MNKKILFSFSTLVLLILFVCTSVVSGQTTLPNGKTTNDSPLTVTPSSDDLIFGYSHYSASNVLIINGTSVPLYGSGWFNSYGEHGTYNENYVCGDLEGNGYYRNFFAIDLTDPVTDYGITLPIISAVLTIEKYVSEPPTGTKQYTLTSTSLPWATINQDYMPGSGIGIGIFSELGQGDVFATTSVDRTTSGLINITLNATALSALNSAVGSIFVISGEADNYVPVPFPYWAIIVVFVLIATTLVLRFRKRIFA